MLRCREVVSFILDYLEGSLDVDTRERFDQHLVRCASCQAYLATYRQTLALERLTAIEDDDVPEELVRVVLASREQ